MLQEIKRINGPPGAIVGAFHRRGQVGGLAGYGGFTDGPYFGLIELPASAIPEPKSSAAMAAVALLGVALWRRGFPRSGRARARNSSDSP